MLNKNHTIRNHIIPCFWSALWNADFFNHHIAGNSSLRNTKLRPREQKVYSLEFKAPKILHRKVDHLFYVRNLGLSLVSQAELSGLHNIYAQIEDRIVTGNYFDKNDTKKEHLVDIEALFKHAEDNYGYKEVLEVIRTNRINSLNEKVHIAIFIAINLIRGLRFFESLFQKYIAYENPKLEVLKHFKAIMSNIDAIYHIVNPLVNARWTLYHVEEDIFPLGDSPVIRNGNITKVIISPKHMIEIDESITNLEKVRYRQSINREKYTILKSEIIKNSYSAIIFPSEEFLSKLKKTDTWKRRKTTVAKIDLSQFYI